MTTTKQAATHEAIRTLSATEIDTVSGGTSNNAGILALQQTNQFARTNAEAKD